LLKIQFKNDLRRINLSDPTSFSYDDLSSQIRSSFQIPEYQIFCIKYFDGEDECVVSSTPELQEAFAVSNSREVVLKLVITLETKDSKPDATQQQNKCWKKQCSARRNCRIVLTSLRLCIQSFISFVAICLAVCQQNFSFCAFRRRKLCFLFFIIFMATLLFARFRLFRLLLVPILGFLCIPFLFSVLRCLSCTLHYLLYTTSQLLTVVCTDREAVCRREKKQKNQSNRMNEQNTTVKNYENNCVKTYFANENNLQQIPQEEKIEAEHCAVEKFDNIELLQIFNTEVNILSDMGFVDKIKNLRILAKNNGKLDDTIHVLLHENK